MRLKITHLLLLLLSVNAFSQVQISEIMASNKTSFPDQFGEYADWIELYNSSSSAVNLSGWSLTDEVTLPQKWVFPSISIPAGGYLVVFASDRNLLDPSFYLHTNFKLSASGEYLGLYDPSGVFVSGFPDGFPIQYEDVSYSSVDARYNYVNVATPWAANSSSYYLATPAFSAKRGVFATPFSLSLTTNLPAATILYTLDGSEPTLTNGNVYQLPLQIDSTAIVRAVCALNGQLSESTTNTYIFASQVLNQSDVPKGYPTTWGTGITADYGMDPEVCNDANSANQILKSFHEMPVVSLVTNPSNFFSAVNDATTGGIYVYTQQDWERPVSVEIFGDAVKTDYQVNCGIQMQGGSSRTPGNSPKHSLRLVFKPEYGPSKMKYELFDEKYATDTYNTILLKSGYNNTWFHWDATQRKQSQYIRDVWAKQTFLNMGQKGVHTKYVQLFLNGLYWGLYDISERVDDDYMKTYYGGDELDYDVVKDARVVVDGGISSWDTLVSRINTGVVDNGSYFKLLGKNSDGTENLAYPSYIDPVNLADYMLLNFYGANQDWDQHNWVAGRNKLNDRDGFRFYAWDTERILENVNSSIVTKNSVGFPTGIFQQMMKNAEFKMLFADRVRKHLFDGGCLTPDTVIAAWNKFAGKIQSAIYAESARWGDYRRDVRPSGTAILYTATTWEEEKNRLVSSYFPARTNVLITQLKNAGMYPTLDAPLFNKYGGEVSADNFKLEMQVASGVIYYSVEGDPRLVGGNVASAAKIYSVPFALNGSPVTVKARTKSGSTWSALTEATFYPAVNSSINMQYSEITELYNYPNPCSTKTTINCTLLHSGRVSVRVLSLQGSVLKNIDLGFRISGQMNYVLDVTGLNNGIYIYQVCCGDDIATEKMTVVR